VRCPAALQLARTEVLEELHRHPLSWYGSTAAQWPGPRSARSSNQPLPPAEVESALLAYVRLAAESEQPQSHRNRLARRTQQLSSTDVTAELHALYTLAAVHVAQQQDRQEQAGGSNGSGSGHARAQSLSDSDLVQLLKAYASLEDSSQQPSSPSRDMNMQRAQQQQKAQAAAAALEALYAFARLADTPQQEHGQQQQQQHNAHSRHHHQQQQQSPGGQAPGQLQASSDNGSAVVAYKHLAAGGSSRSPGASGDSPAGSSSSVSSSASGDLQVLLKLAQLGLQAS
jgi:hypothetical protein